MKCKYCGCEEYYCKKVGPHIGAYCSECEKWIKWLPQTELKKIAENEYKTVSVCEPYFVDSIYDDDCPF